MTAEQDSPGHQQASHQKQTIVLVEDNPQIRYIIASFIDLATPYEVQSFSDGQELLHYLDDLQNTPPVLFLLDYHLPTMTGLQLYDQLQHIEGVDQVPALLITAEPSLQFEKELAARHLPVLSKPFTFKEFLAALTPLLT